MNRIKTILFTEYKIDLSERFIKVNPFDNEDSHMFYTNSLYIIGEDQYSQYLITTIKKYSRNSIIVYIYKNINQNNSLIDYTFSYSNFFANKLNLSKIYVKYEEKYQHLVDYYSSIDEEFIMQDITDLETINYLQNCNVLYLIKGFFYLDIKSLSNKIVNNSNEILIEYIMVENELAFFKNGEIIIPSLLKDRHDFKPSIKEFMMSSYPKTEVECIVEFLNTPYEVFEKLCCKLSSNVDEIYRNFLMVNSTCIIMYKDKTLIFIGLNYKKIKILLEYIRYSFSKFEDFDSVDFIFGLEHKKQEVKNKLVPRYSILKSLSEKALRFLERNIWLIAKVNGNSYYKFFLNQEIDFKTGTLSVYPILETKEQITSFEPKNDFNKLILDIISFSKQSEIEILTELNGEILSSFEWVSYTNSGNYDENFNSYLDGDNMVRYVYPGNPIKKSKIDFDYIKKLCNSLSYEEKESKNRLKVNIFGAGETGKTTLINKLKTGYFQERQFTMTDGIEYTQWNIDDNNIIYFSDMGGQYTYIRTNELFLKDGDLFFLVMNFPAGHGNSQLPLISKYLEIIEKKCPNSKMYVILSKHEEYEYEDRKEESILDYFNKKIEKVIKINSRTGYNIDLITKIIADEVGKNNYYLPKSYELIHQKMRLLEEFIFQEKEFYDMIEGVEDKESFCNFLEKIGFLRKQYGFVILGDFKLSRELTKMISCHTKYQDCLFDKILVEDFEQLYKDSHPDFIKKFCIENRLIFVKHDCIFLPANFELHKDSYKNNFSRLDVETLPFFEHEEKIENKIFYTISNFSSIDIFFEKLFSYFCDYIDEDNLHSNCFYINIDYGSKTYKVLFFLSDLSSDFTSLNIYFFTLDHEIVSKVMQMLSLYFKDYFSEELFYTNEKKMKIDYRVFGQDQIFHNFAKKLDDAKSDLRGLVPHKNFTHVFMPFYKQLKLDDGVLIITNKERIKVKYDIELNYINIEDVIPESKIMFLVYYEDEKAFKVPISKNETVFKNWIIAEKNKIEIQNLENARLITDYERTVLTEFLNKDISKYEFLIIEDGKNSDLYIPIKNCFGKIDYIFKEEYIDFFYDINDYKQNNIQLEFIKKNLESSCPDLGTFLAYIGRIDKAPDLKTVKKIKNSAVLELEDCFSEKYVESLENIEYKDLDEFKKKLSPILEEIIENICIIQYLEERKINILKIKTYKIRHVRDNIYHVISEDNREKYVSGIDAKFINITDFKEILKNNLYEDYIALKNLFKQ